MATLNFLGIEQESEKAVKVMFRESDYDLEKMKVISKVSIWIPKSVCKISNNTIEVADWFYEKNIAVDAYSAFMKAMSNN
jgi:hypothetical protein